MVPKTNRLDWEVFRQRILDSHSFYQDLPSDNISICGVPEVWKELDHILAELESTELYLGNSQLLDALIAYLANNRDLIKPEERWRELADAASLAYARLLKGRANRELRMRLQQLNYFIRDLLDRDCRVTFVSEKSLAVNSPWDWLNTSEAEFLITSEDKNVQISRNGRIEFLRCGFPTQIDMLPNKQVGIGSIFSNGGYLLRDQDPEWIAHHSPIVLFFAFEDSIHFVDYGGFIVRLKDRVVLHQLNVSEVSRARVINGNLFAFDWTKPNAMIVYEMENSMEREISLNEVLLGNDICAFNENFYVIDKQQGHVFKYDSQLQYIEKRLCFGKGMGRLFDPITIRFYEGLLYILNWISRKIVVLEPF